MLSGPEMARLLKQFEEECIHGDNTEMFSNLHQHEQGLSTQKTFQQQVVSLAETIKWMGNPFFDIFPHLVTLDSRNCTAESVVTTVRNLEETRKKHYRDFVKNVLQEHSHSIHDPIKKNSLALFRKPHCKTNSTQGKRIKVLKNNVALYGQLYISMQNRDADLDEFFAHEIQSFPPSLSDFGKLHLPLMKSDLLQCFKVKGGATCFLWLHTSGWSCHCPLSSCHYTVAICRWGIFPYLKKQWQSSRRLDIVWDTYVADSLKNRLEKKERQRCAHEVIGWDQAATQLDGLPPWLCKQQGPVCFADDQGWGVHLAIWQRCVCVIRTSSVLIWLQQPDEQLQSWRSRHRSCRSHSPCTSMPASFTICLRSNLWLIYGLPLAWEKNFRFCHINAACACFGECKSRALPVFMRILGVTPPPHSMAKAKSPLGKPRTHTKMPQRSLFIWQNIRTSCWTLTLTCSRSWKDRQSSSMTEPVLWPPSIKQDESYSATKIMQ